MRATGQEMIAFEEMDHYSQFSRVGAQRSVEGGHRERPGSAESRGSEGKTWQVPSLVFLQEGTGEAVKQLRAG